MIKLNYSHITQVNAADLDSLRPALAEADCKLRNKSGAGSEYTDWLTLPQDYDRDELARIKKAAAKIRSDSDVLLVVGIGGSYLGARAVIEFLFGQYYNLRSGCPQIYFTGNSFSGEELETLLKACDGKRVSVNVISKSGTTTECAAAFRIIRAYMQKRYDSRELAGRIYATTDKSRGALRALADKEGYETFVVPDGIGGRFSVLTAVGLLPIAAAGGDIEALMSGAEQELSEQLSAGLTGSAYTYALLRNAFIAAKKSCEVLVSYDPFFRCMGEWFKQLFGESEGKDKKGLFPVSVGFSTDLHSLGQFIQDGSPMLFETICRREKSCSELAVPFESGDGDGLNYLAGKTLDEINETALAGTLMAHRDGGTESIVISYPDRSESSLGKLISFFFLACGASAYILGVNPFNQPGVEAYKKNMFALLGKPGYEEQRKKLENEKINFSS